MTEQELIDVFEERAAIMEYCGGLLRHEAELAAYADWRRVVGNGVAAPAKIQEVVRQAREKNAVRHLGLWE